MSLVLYPFLLSLLQHFSMFFFRHFFCRANPWCTGGAEWCIIRTQIGLIMKIDVDFIKKQKINKRWIWILTLFYLILFPFLLYASLFSVAILNPSGVKFLQWVFILLCLSIPLSIPFSIFFMWRQYFKKNITRTRFFFVLPIIIAVIYYFLIDFLGSFLIY